MGGSSIMATAGKVAPTPKDKFVNGTAYDKLDVVEYNGTLYIAKKASAGVLPDDTEYWMLAVDLTGKLDTTGDTENNTVTFTSGDATDPTAWKNVTTLSSKEKHSSLLNKISTMFSNVRYLYKLLGTTDISALGTVTQALANLDGNVGDIKGIISSLADCSAATVAGYAADALAVKELNSNFQIKEYINQLVGIDVNILFSVIFCYGKTRQLIIRAGGVPANSVITVTTLPEVYRPRHKVYGTPIIGVPSGSGNNYLMRVEISSDGNVTVANYSDYDSTETYIDVMYVAVG